MSHYYTNDPQLKHQYTAYETVIKDEKFIFHTDSGVFSKSGLDFGTRVLLNTIHVDENVKKILDMGCGYGPIGIFLGRAYPDLDITMVDVNERAVGLVEKNIAENKTSANVLISNLFEKIEGTFDLIVSNPPIRTGKENLYTFYREALTYLNPSGVLWLVVAKKQGAESTVSYLKTLYKEVKVVEKHKGYHIICAFK